MNGSVGSVTSSVDRLFLPHCYLSVDAVIKEVKNRNAMQGSVTSTVDRPFLRSCYVSVDPSAKEVIKLPKGYSKKKFAYKKTGRLSTPPHRRFTLLHRRGARKKSSFTVVG